MKNPNGEFTPEIRKKLHALLLKIPNPQMITFTPKLPKCAKYHYRTLPDGSIQTRIPRKNHEL